ncbi:hypothetical protein CLTEP_25870 [Clostridium tepidiprofundi DSM 19306]|uniref:Uncharacterized protein n=1 Tax=Clostridium tepidiprofundi DSM 19306 TaxID=1121338 RepID=A0A151ASF5_9CLOT|nr:hypothetical protein [Clostridium tepidiprofundi]KYH30545.1 hypothetical protein CLTEP_25870 [Clostridium tepidiprofundi DSM 19306]
MKSFLIDKIIVIVAILVFLAFLVGVIQYKSNRAFAIHTSGIKIIKAEDIEKTKERDASFAVKVHKQNDYYLEVFETSPTGNDYVESRFDLDKKDFDCLEIGKTYWFYVKLNKSDNSSSHDGRVKKIYTENPCQ